MESPDEKSPPVTTSGDTENRTHFHPGEGKRSEADRRREVTMPQWQRLKMLNEGMWNGPCRENKQALHRQDDLHIFDAIVCQLELTTHQKEEGRRIFDGLRNDKLGLPVEQVAFAVCIAVVNRDVEGTRYWPTESKQDNDELFTTVGKDLGLSLRKQLSTLMKVKDRTGL